MKKELDKELYPDYVYPEFTPDPGKPFREPIAKLGKKITDRIPQKLGLKKITRNDPEYWGLAGVLTDEEALLALKLGVRKPKTLPEIVKLSGLEEKKCTHFRIGFQDFCIHIEEFCTSRHIHWQDILFLMCSIFPIVFEKTFT